MAGNDSAMGMAITVPDSVFTDLDRLEKKIMGLGTITNNISGNIVAAFKRMAAGVDPFLSKVESAESALKRLGNADISKSFSSIGQYSGDVDKAASSMTDMANAMNRLGGSSKSIAELKDSIKTLNKELSDIENPLYGAEQQLKVDERYDLKTALKEAETSSQQRIEVERKRIESESKLDEKAYQAWLKRKSMEQEAAQKAEDKKFAATRDRIYRQNRLFEQEAKKRQESYAEQNRLAKENSAQAQKSYNERLRMYEQMFDEMERRQRKAYLQTPTGALESADNARTYAQRAQAMRNLEAAIKNLDSTEKDYQKTLDRLSARYKQLKAEQDKVAVSMNGVKKSQHQLMDISGQLMRRLALVFSVSQITQYVQTLARVRGEFELQNAALTAIMQNKDEADKLFGQITELAVQSPFQLKELVTYTKELAAYRIENEKLYDTTKMLADVSAGLGVDMSRLILAYGQVKAANYLRGTELRQFSEAGINILGELATYFSEIENRAVSVGEVFEMVSNRMVTFGDVEEIFRRITSDGGIFANMQEVQSRTLAGMISNMRDSVDVMLNEIGKANEDVLKGSVEAVGDLMKNWREVVFVIKEIGVIISPIASYFALAKVASSGFAKSLMEWAVKIPGINTMLGKTTEWLNKMAQRGPRAAKGINILRNALGGIATIGAVAVITAIAGALINLYRTATQARREAERLSKELGGIFTEDIRTARNNVAMYEELVEKLKDVNQGSQEHRDIIAQLNSQYGEYIGYIVTEQTSYEQLKDSIDAVTESIMRRARAASQEKALQAVYQSVSNDIADAQTELRDVLSTGIISGIGRSATESEINSIFGLIEKRIKEEGKTFSNALDLKEVLTQFYQMEAAIPLDSLKALETLRDAYRREMSAELRMEQQINEAYGKRYDTAEQVAKIDANNATRDAELAALEKRTDLSKWQYNQEKARIEQLYKLKEIDLNVDFGLFTPEEGERQKNAILHWATDTIADVNRQIEEDLKGKGFTDELISNFLVTLDMQKSGIPEIEKSVIANYRQTEESIERQNRLKTAGNAIDEELLASLNKRLQGYYAMAEALGIVDQLQEKQAGRSKTQMTLYDKQIDAIKRAGKAYQNELELYDPETARRNIENRYRNLFDELGIGNLIGTMEFDAGGIVAALESLIERASKEAGEKGKIAIEKAVAETKAEINVDVRTEAIGNVGDSFDDLMSGYNIAVQLDETGLDKDAIAQMFGIDETSISGIRKAIEQAWIDAANSQEQVLAQMENRAAITYTNVGKAVQSLGQEGVKAFQSQVDAMDKALAEEQKKWMDLFIDYIAKSVDEIKQAQNEGAVGIGFAKQFFDEGKLSAQQYGTVIKNIIQDTNEEISKINLEKFKDSPEYIQAMGNLAAYSAGELQILLDKLRKFIAESSGNIDASDMEAYMNAIERVQEQIDKLRSPLENNPFSEYSRLVALEKEFNAAQENHNRLLEEQAIRQRTVLLYEQKLAELKQRQQNGEDVGAEIWATDADLISATENLENANKQVKVSQANLGNISGEIENITDGASIGLVKVQKIVDGITQSVEVATVLFDEIKGIADSFGADTDEGAWKEASLIIGSIGDFASGAGQSVTKFMSGDIFGGIISAVQTVGGLVKNINAIHDNRREQIIINETEKVEDLERAYENLQDRMDEISSASQANELKESLERNYDQQIESYKRMIAAEQDKKDSDNEQIKEYQQAIEDLEKRQAEDLESILTTAGGMAKSEYLSAADEFVDSWLSAFQETGDGLSGLEGNFNEFFLDVLKRQAALQIVSKWTDQISDSVNAALKDDSALTTDEGRKIIEDAMAQLPGLNEALKNFFAAYSDIVQDAETAEGSLSGLQKGIQGVTEETAQVLEALLNSMRYYVADSNLQLHNIYMLFSGNEAVPNPMLAELRTQTEQIRAINKLIRNVTASGHPKGGDGIKIFMN